MNTTLCRGALALALLGGVALISAPAQAGSLQDEGDFGGTWTSHRAQRSLPPPLCRSLFGAPAIMVRRPTPITGPGLTPITGRPVYGAPDEYDYGPGIALVAPGVGLAIDID